jgi:hypothetical protein
VQHDDFTLPPRGGIACATFLLENRLHDDGCFIQTASGSVGVGAYLTASLIRRAHAALLSVRWPHVTRICDLKRVGNASPCAIDADSAARMGQYTKPPSTTGVARLSRTSPLRARHLEPTIESELIHTEGTDVKGLRRPERHQHRPFRAVDPLHQRGDAEPDTVINERSGSNTERGCGTKITSGIVGSPTMAGVGGEV